MTRKPLEGRARPKTDRTQSAELSRELERASRRAGALRGAANQEKRKEAAETDERFALRTMLPDKRESDPFGYERIIGKSDLMSINFLDRGRRAAAAVCRISVSSDGDQWHGTAFLVGPRLLLTNHHVLGNPDEASRALAQFGYEHDLDGALRQPVNFGLNPTEIFYTDAACDFTFVAVNPYSDANVPLSRFGRLPLLPVSGKAVDGEWATIVQHPEGLPKQIAIRASQVVALGKDAVPNVDLDTFIHYITDTGPGSSGSPVFNDQWQVFALHHKAIASPDTLDKPEAERVWIGNEGIRVSAIFARLQADRFMNPQAARVLDRLDRALGFEPVSAVAAVPGPAQREAAFEADGRAFGQDRWAGISGYDPDFLTLRTEDGESTVRIGLDVIVARARSEGQVAPLKDGGWELKYRHFSSVIHRRRKFPLITAVNIEGGMLRKGPKRPPWRPDARIDEVYQPGGNFYETARGDDPVDFSRGHQVRFLDPNWGPTADEAQDAGRDTFHYTNAAPQVQRYNDTDWGNLEDYVLDKAQVGGARMSVFTGPIYRDDDPWYGKNREGGPWRIPISFWKIAVLKRSDTAIAAAAFIVGQTSYVKALYEAKVFSGLKPYSIDEIREAMIQTTVAAIEHETGLDFSALREFDAHGSLESTRRTRWISGADDILI